MSKLNMSGSSYRLPETTSSSGYLAQITAMVLALVVMLHFTPVYAQTVDKTGACPADQELPRLDATTDYFTVNGKPDLYVGADDDRRLLPEVSLALPMQTAIIRVAKSGNRVFLRSQKKVLNDDFVCGWISEQSVLPRNSKPVTVGTPIDFTDPVTGVTKELNNPLPMKALLRSNPEFESKDATLVSIYEKPSITSATRTEASVFGIYLIYKQEILPDGLWYWIAGENPWLPTRFAGWVPDHHVLIWESQLSVYFNEQTKDTDIHYSFDSAATADPTGVLAKRPDDYIEHSKGPPDPDDPVENNIARFPILLEESTSEDMGQSIYRIGFFGDSKVVEEASLRGRIQQNVRKVDILFVLDNTKSMTEYFPYVVQAVRNATDTIAQINAQEGYDVEVKYAAAVYGDYLESPDSLKDTQFQILARLASPGYTEHLGRLTAVAEDVDYYRDALRDIPEAGLAGVVRGIEELEWSNETEFKVVVWIGDHGSREVGSTELLSIDYVRQVIIDNNVVLLPINVSGRYDDVWNGEFVRQGNELAAIRGLDTKLAYRDTRDANYELAGQLIEEAIANIYVSALTTSFAIREGTNVEQTPQRKKLLELGIPAAEADVLKISTAICEIAFGNRGCENVSSSGQFMAEGYVRYSDSIRNFDFWVNLEFVQLDILTRVMQLTCRGFDRSNVKKNIENAMTIVQTTMGGTTYRSDIPVGEYLRQYLFLPARHFPSILESTPDRIEEQWQQARDADTRNGNLNQTYKIADPICRSAALLRLAFDNKRLIDFRSDLVRTSSLSGEQVSEYTWSVVSNDRLIDFNWEWSQGGENNYFYLPVEFLPSSIDIN